MPKDSCLSKITAGVGYGGAFGAAYGVICGTRDAFSRNDPFRGRIPGLLKIRHVAEITLAWAAIFGFVGGVCSLICCVKSKKESSWYITNNKSVS